VVANGDITTPEKARDVMALTGADAVMIGRAAQGRPWIFREIAHFLTTGTQLAPPLVADVKRLLLDHLQDHYSLYGDFLGVRTARKHIGWYVKSLPGGEDFRARMNLIDDCQLQTLAVADFFDALAVDMDRIPASGQADIDLDDGKALNTEKLCGDELRDKVLRDKDSNMKHLNEKTKKLAEVTA
jgi:tRNA-dihydrouridine synthase B